MSDRAELHAFLRSTAKAGGSVGGREAGHLLADYDRLLAAVIAALDESDTIDVVEDGRPAQAALRHVVTDLTT